MTPTPGWDIPPDYYAPDPDDDQPSEPITIDEVWDGARAEYVTQISLNGIPKFHIYPARSGPFVGDYAISGDGYYSEGWVTLDRAIACAVDRLEEPS